MWRTASVALLFTVGLWPGAARALAADAQVRGRVLDATTSAPLARVTIAAGDQQAQTDAGGRFELRLAPGEWRVTVVASGYLDFEERIRLAANEVRTLEILLVHRRAYEERCLLYTSPSPRD